ncbi:hypothetical protein [Crateriforma spongiae]|nr:hypothetical protein [Crateriforma spongiae]
MIGDVAVRRGCISRLVTIMASMMENADVEQEKPDFGGAVAAA